MHLPQTFSLCGAVTSPRRDAFLVDENFPGQLGGHGEGAAVVRDVCRVACTQDPRLEGGSYELGLKKKAAGEWRRHTDFAKVEIGIVVEPMQGQEADISRVGFVYALQEDGSVGP